jgi:hypothetical protein
MTQTAIVVHRSKSKMIRLFLGALVFVALGALITKVIYDEQGAGAFRVFIGLFTMLFFGVCAIAGLVKLLDKRPALEFLNEGLLARDISATPIRWEDIEAARLLTYRLPERGRIGYPAGHTHRDDRRMGAAGSACCHSPSRAAIKKRPGAVAGSSYPSQRLA